MKKLDVIVHIERVGAVSNSLRKNDVGGLTFYHIRGRGRSIETNESYMFDTMTQIEAHSSCISF
jgi:nitrogen regulatory protein PII